LPSFGSGLSQTDTLTDRLTDSGAFRGDRADSARGVGGRLGAIGAFASLDELSLFW
jgi:hypothetical protein